jgi:hypothetical protein
MERTSYMLQTRKFAARRTRVVYGAALIFNTAFLGLIVWNSFYKTAEETSKNRLRPWYQDRWVQFCRNNTISGLLEYRGSTSEIGGGWCSAFVSKSLVKIL